MLMTLAYGKGDGADEDAARLFVPVRSRVLDSHANDDTLVAPGECAGSENAGTLDVLSCLVNLELVKSFLQGPGD